MMTRTVSVVLGSAIQYVTGTVNGVAVTFTRAEGYTWTATVARADDDIYAVAITAIDGGGNVTSTSLTLYYGLHLITDRVSGAKYNADDLNRVEAAVAYLDARLDGCGYLAAVGEIKRDWVMGANPSAVDLARYLGNVRAISETLPMPPGTPELPPRMSASAKGAKDGLAYTGANNIEINLLATDQMITNLQAAYFYAGEVYAGET